MMEPKPPSPSLKSKTSPPTASLPDILSTLKLHLLPTPSLRAFPTTLQLLAHFQLVLRLLKTEAARALAAHAELTARLERQGIEYVDQVRHGALSKKEGSVLERIRDRDDDEAMLAFSLEFRRIHIAILLSTPSIALPQVLHLINVYLPDMPAPSPADPTPWTRHDMLFIKCMTAGQADRLRSYRERVMGWHRETARRCELRQKRRRFDHFVGNNQRSEEMLDAIATEAIKEAERVVRDVRVMEGMFRESRGCSREDEAGTLPGHLQERIKRPDADEIGRASIAHPPSSSSLHRESTPSRTPQPRRPSPTSSSSSSSDDIVHIPRLSIDMSRGRSRPRISLSNRDGTPFSAESGQSPSVPLRKRAGDVGDTSTGTGFSPGDENQSNSQSSPRVRKKPRTSGLPPLTGPDYSAPSPKMGENVDRGLMHPWPRPRGSHGSAGRTRLSLGSERSASDGQSRPRDRGSLEDEVEWQGESRVDKGKAREMTRASDVFA